MLAGFLFSFERGLAEVFVRSRPTNSGSYTSGGRVPVSTGWPLQFLRLEENTSFSFLPFIFDLSLYFIFIWVGLGFMDKLAKKKK